MKNALPLHPHPSPIAYPLRPFYFILLIISLACTKPPADTHSGVILGHILLIGHEPFPQLALEDTTGTVYVLRCPEETRKKLEEQQGQRVRLHCSSILKNEHQNRATVEYFVVIENES
jgi:hypothetical protein